MTSPQASSTGGEVFRNEQLYSVLAQNPATAKYLGQPDVCLMLSELRSNPSTYAKHSKDPRIAEIAAQLSQTSVRPSWPPSWSSYSRSDSNTTQYNSGGDSGFTGSATSWRSARKTAARPSRSAPSFEASIFFAAVRTGNLNNVSVIVDQNETALFQEDDFGYTALHLAAQNGHTQIVTYLLGKGVDVDLKQAAGYTPLHMAVLSDKTHVALTLIDNGANVHAKDNEGNTALEYALRNDNPELISVLIEAATGDAAQQAQRQQKRQQNERRRQTSSLALPEQVERKLVRGARRNTSSTSNNSRRPAPSLFDDSDDTDLFGDAFGAVEKSEKESIQEEEENAPGIGDLFGFGEEDDEGDDVYLPKAKEVEPATNKRTHESEKEEVAWGAVSSLFGDDDDALLFASTSTTSSIPSSPSPLTFNVSTSTSTSVSSTSLTAAVSVKTPAPTPAVATASLSVVAIGGSDEVTSLLQQIQKLQDQLAEKDRQLLARDDKISILEEDTYCRICMDKKVETVLLWCGHNILCVDCAQRVQKAKKECPVCAKAITRVVRTYRA